VVLEIYIGSTFTGALLYADRPNIVLLACICLGLQKLINILSHSVCSRIFDLILSKVRLLVLVVNLLSAIASISEVNLLNGQTASNTLTATFVVVESKLIVQAML